jgi:hypothetical protein
MSLSSIRLTLNQSTEKKHLYNKTPTKKQRFLASQVGWKKLDDYEICGGRYVLCFIS